MKNLILLVTTICFIYVGLVFGSKEQFGCYKVPNDQPTCELQNQDSQEKLKHKLKKSIAHGIQWMREQTHNYPLLSSDILQTFLLSGYLNDGGLCTKNLNTEKEKLLKELNNPDDIPGGKLAKILIGLKASCYDDVSHKQKLINILKRKMAKFPRGEFNNFFQLSLAMIALYVNNEEVASIYGEKLLHGVFIGKKRFKKLDKHKISDTEALSVMALYTILKQDYPAYWVERHGKREVIKIETKINEILSAETSEDNLVTLSLILQTIPITNLHFKKQPFCEKTLKSVLHLQNKDGSFGNLQETTYALMALNGRSILDIKDIKCPLEIEERNEKAYQHFLQKYKEHKEEKENSPKEKGVAVKKLKYATLKLSKNIEEESKIEQMVVHFKSKHTALELLKKAGKSNSCFVPETRSSSWGEYITRICNIKQNHHKRAYWLFYVNGKLSDVGSNKYDVKDNDVIEFKYSTV